MASVRLVATKIVNVPVAVAVATELSGAGGFVLVADEPHPATAIAKVVARAATAPRRSGENAKVLTLRGRCTQRA